MGSVVVRTQISLDEDQYRFLKQHAHERGESLSAVVRRAVDQLRQREARPVQRALDVLGTHEADVLDAAEHHDHYLLLAAEPTASWPGPEDVT